MVLAGEVDPGQVPAGCGDPVEIAEVPVHLQPLALEVSCLLVVPAMVGDVRDPAPGDGGGPG